MILNINKVLRAEKPTRLLTPRHLCRGVHLVNQEAGGEDKSIRSRSGAGEVAARGLPITQSIRGAFVAPGDTIEVKKGRASALCREKRSLAAIASSQELRYSAQNGYIISHHGTSSGLTKTNLKRLHLREFQVSK